MLVDSLPVSQKLMGGSPTASQRHCVFRDFEYASNEELGEKVCTTAERQQAGTVIVGKSADTSELRR